MPGGVPSLPAPTCCTASGCAASAAAATPGTSSVPPSPCSTRWAWRLSLAGPGPSCAPLASGPPYAAPGPRKCSPHRRNRSPGWLPSTCPTGRSPPGCSSAPAPSSTTCTRPSASLASAIGPSSPGRSGTTKEHSRSRTDGELRPALDTDSVVDLGDARRGPGGGHRVIVRGQGADRARQDHQPVTEGLDREPVRL